MTFRVVISPIELRQEPLDLLEEDLIDDAVTFIENSLLANCPEIQLPTAGLLRIILTLGIDPHRFSFPLTSPQRLSDIPIFQRCLRVFHMIAVLFKQLSMELLASVASSEGQEMSQESLNRLIRESNDNQLVSSTLQVRALLSKTFTTCKQSEQNAFEKFRLHQDEDEKTIATRRSTRSSKRTSVIKPPVPDSLKNLFEVIKWDEFAGSYMTIESEQARQEEDGSHNRLEDWNDLLKEDAVVFSWKDSDIVWEMIGQMFLISSGSSTEVKQCWVRIEPFLQDLVTLLECDFSLPFSKSIIYGWLKPVNMKVVSNSLIMAVNYHDRSDKLDISKTILLRRRFIRLVYDCLVRADGYNTGSNNIRSLSRSQQFKKELLNDMKNADSLSKFLLNQIWKD